MYVSTGRTAYIQCIDLNDKKSTDTMPVFNTQDDQ